MDWGTAFAAIAAALAASAIGIVTLWLVPGRGDDGATRLFDGGSIGTVLLFDGDALLDATPDARALLAASRTPGSAWVRLMAYLAPRFDQMDARLKNLRSDGQIELHSPSSAHPVILRAEYRGGVTRIELVDAAEAAHQVRDPLALRAIHEEITLLREAISSAPLLIWRENIQGEVIWANGPYLLQSCATLAEGKELGWPLPKLFATAAPNQLATDHRQSLDLPAGKKTWFNITTKSEETALLRYAASADAAVQAEASLRDFMQTLTKTFAQLPIGLAIFDAERKLQLFNPALLDLTHLPADFLSMRPSLLAVLDAMRDRKMLPEPKDYRSWRRQIVEMEKAAASGQYEETWNLPDGQTLRVMGRPHPNGAIAMMIEDISTEMLRTRRYRADLALGQAVVDQVEDAMAVFDQGGHLVMSNTAYAQLWSHDPSEAMTEYSLRRLTTHWRSVAAPSALWAELEDYVATVGDREAWQGEVRFLDGRLVACRFAPLAGGSTLAQFRVQVPKAPAKPKLAATNKRGGA